MKRNNVFRLALAFIACLLFWGATEAKAEIQVYDKNNQYLGILLNLSGYSVEVFIPSLGAAMEFTWPGSSCGTEYPYFESGDCSGTPYARYPFAVIYEIGTKPGEFYIPDPDSKKTVTYNSNYDSDDCECTLRTEQAAEYYQLIPVQLPFSTPVAFPLHYEVRNRVVVIPLN